MFKLGMVALGLLLIVQQAIILLQVRQVVTSNVTQTILGIVQPVLVYQIQEQIKHVQVNQLDLYIILLQV